MRQQINLYIDLKDNDHEHFNAIQLWRTSAMVVAGIVILVMLNLWQISRLRDGVQEVDIHYNNTQERFKTLNVMIASRPRDRLLEQEVTRLQRLLQSRHRIQEMLQGVAFSNTDGFSKYFRSLARQHTQGLWLTDFAISGAAQKVTLGGRSSDAALVPEYLRKLSNEAALTGIEFYVFRIVHPESEEEIIAKSVVDFVVTTEKPEFQDGLHGNDQIARAETGK
ncbi:MAG: hypothetical protein BMS9Abin36_1575 [Gammaproteobacteria bacterium]|nr:MAG: hypothetical protein BMS9Abin36_1575 [Gammaproteobacteria bacterium]